MARGRGVTDLRARLLAGFLCVAGLALPAVAQPPEGSAPLPREVHLALLRAADADGDGTVTWPEAAARFPTGDVAAVYVRLERNGDAVLTRADIGASASAPSAALTWALTFADSDGDGRVRRQEFRASALAAVPALFDAVDANRDGVLTETDAAPRPADPARDLVWHVRELFDTAPQGIPYADAVRLVPQLAPETFAALDSDGDAMVAVTDLPPGPQDKRETFLQLLDTLDADADGTVTRDEALTAAPPLTAAAFIEMDRTRDGRLTRADLPGGPVPFEDDARAELFGAVVAADAARDGALSYADLCGVFPDAAAALLDALDSNGDAKLTRAELQATLAMDGEGVPLVSHADVNADGRVNAVDMQQAVNDLLGRPSDLLPADIDGNGAVDSVDVQLVVRWMLTGE